MSNLRKKEFKKKMCNDCSRERLIRFFSQRKNDHNTKIKYYNAFCKDCMTDRSTQWRIDNRDRYNTKAREIYSLNKIKLK